MAYLSREEREILEQKTGLDELRQFIKDSDYTDDLIKHAAMGAPDLTTDNLNPTRRDMIERSKAIFTYLRDSGRDFTVTPDRTAGQLTAKLTDSKIQIRVMDTDADAQYVGRVHDGRNSNGLTYTFSTKQWSLRPNVTPDMAVSMVKYALGESVNRIDNSNDTSRILNEHVGLPSEKSKKPETFVAANTSSHAVTAFTTKIVDGKLINVKTDSGFNRTINDNVYIYVKNDRNSSNISMKFRGDNALSDSENFIEDARDAAINNFTNELKLSAVDKLARSKANDEFDGLPAFSASSSFITDMQKAYYDKRLSIYKNDDGLYESDIDRNDALYDHDESFKKTIRNVFGNVQERSINPTNVAAYMDVTKGTINNEASLLSALKTTQKNNVPYEILGEGFAEDNFKDKMLSYDDSPVYDKNGNQIYPRNINPTSADFKNLSAFWQTIGNTAYTSLSETGVNVKSISLDKSGVIHYEGDRHVGASVESKPENKVMGDIGQVFEPINQMYKEDGSLNPKHGLIETKFNSNNNYYIAAGYTAYIVPPQGENFGKTVEERTRLRGYEEMITKSLKSKIRGDVIASNNSDNTTDLNNVYHHIYGNKLPLDFVEQMGQEGKDNSVINTITKSIQQRVRYDNIYKDEADILSKAAAERLEFKPNRGYNVYLDNVQTVMAIMNPETSKGYFDSYATGAGLSQGIVRYLAEDAKVDDEGKIIKGESTKTALTAHSDFKYAEFNPPDRFIMSYMNALNQSSTARGRDTNLDGEKIKPIGVGTAHMSLGGYTQDDAFVISSDFANSNQIRGKDGNMRVLQIGDKICDHSGNKGVISFIADRNSDMSYYEPNVLHAGMSNAEHDKVVKSNYAKSMQKNVVDVFRNNPSLDVIGAPYTAPSRFNGGTAREMIDSQAAALSAGMPTTLVMADKQVEGGIGYPTWIVTDMPVDEKTHVYDTEGGRKSSGQLIWALSEAGAKDVIDEIYKYNNAPTEKAREMLITLGCDISQTGELHKGYEPHVVRVDENGVAQFEQRNVYSIRDVFNSERDGEGKSHKKNFSNAFGTMMNNDGGFMAIPFPVKLASGEMTQERCDVDGKGTGEYMLPILSGKYRSGRETVDNKLLLHEYTTDYKSIYDKVGDYLRAEESFKDAVASQNGDAVSKYKQAMDDANSFVQNKYDSLSEDIITRHFEGKDNIWKSEIMRKQLANTATVVITPDPTLDVDEICMTATLAESIGLKSTDPDPRTIMWRDPVLSAGGTRYPRVKIIENRPGYDGYDERNPMNKMTGIGMNPSAANSYEADFDGDSTGLYTPQSKKAKANAMATLSYEAQLLNKEVGKRGEHSLYFTDGLDVAAGIFADKEKGGHLSADFEAIRKLANKADFAKDMRVDKDSDNHKALELLNNAMHKTHETAFGEDIISYKNAEEHFKSTIHMTQSGAKGSPSKLVNGYGKYFGCEAEIDENYNLVKFRDVGAPIASITDRAASLEATHAKAVLTGVAGKFSQHAAMFAKNSNDTFSNSAAANALTHSVTQSVLQLKHNSSDEIRQKMDMVKSVAPALWSGQKIEKVDGKGGNPTWQVVYEKDNKTNKNKPVQMTPDEFKKSFMDFYTDKHGLAVPAPNPEHLDTMARIMTVKENGVSVIKGWDSKHSNEITAIEKPLDTLAYEGSFEKVCALANNSVDLFSGSVNSLVAPTAIRNNKSETLKAQMDPDYTPKLKTLSAKDTQVKNGVVQPSVDEIDEIIRQGNINSVKIEPNTVDSAVNQSVQQNNNVKDINNTKPVAFDFNRLTSDEKSNLAQSIAFKSVNAGSDSFTADEQAYRVIINEQGKSFKALGNTKARNAYIENNPNDFKEYREYKTMYDDCRKASNAGKIETSADLTSDVKTKVESTNKPAMPNARKTAPAKDFALENMIRLEEEMIENMGVNEDACLHHCGE